MDDRRNLRKRTKVFALDIIKVYAGLPKTTIAQVLGKQMLSSGTSVGAHYREASRARSTAEFISKIEVGLQELDETTYWIGLLADSGIGNRPKLAELTHEAAELIAIFVASVGTAKQRR